MYYEKSVYFKIMRLIFKETDLVVIKNFIFDVFTKYSKDEVMDSKQIEEVFSVLGR
jgi:hypothetical protein